MCPRIERGKYLYIIFLSCIGQQLAPQDANSATLLDHTGINTERVSAISHTAAAKENARMEGKKYMAWARGKLFKCLCAKLVRVLWGIKTIRISSTDDSVADSRRVNIVLAQGDVYSCPSHVKANCF